MTALKHRIVDALETEIEKRLNDPKLATTDRTLRLMQTLGTWEVEDQLDAIRTELQNQREAQERRRF